MIKYYGADVLYNVIDRAIQAHGSLGFSTDLPLEHMYRAARAARIYDGPDEVHKVTVARQVLKRYTPADVPTEHVPTRREAAESRFAELLNSATDSALSQANNSSARLTPAITDEPLRSTAPPARSTRTGREAPPRRSSLEPGQGRPEAEVVTESEGDVRVRVATDVEVAGSGRTRPRRGWPRRRP